MNWTQVKSGKILKRNSFQISPLTIQLSYTNCYSGLWNSIVDITVCSVAMEKKIYFGCWILLYLWDVLWFFNKSLDLNVLSQNRHGKLSPSICVSACFDMLPLLLPTLLQTVQNIYPSLCFLRISFTFAVMSACSLVSM